MRTYQQVLDFLYSQLPMFQRTGAAAYKDNLDNTIRLDEMFDHPHRSFKTIHVAGTNGKGSVSHMLASILQEAGYKTGLYTSPHLKDFRERIRVNGEMITEEAVVRFTDLFQAKNELEKIEPSFFELTVSMAFDYFRSMNVDVAVIEVGLGGRLDSTNIITPEVSVITNISFDHMALLGDTLPKIAAEKAGIIKKDVPVVVGETAPETRIVFEQFAEKVQARLAFADQEYLTDYSMLTVDGKQSLNIRKNDQLIYSDLKLDLLGIYQRHNVPTVLKVIDLLNEKGWNLSESIIRKGLLNVIQNTGLLGRWQIIGHNPLVVCDTGHNQAGIKLVVEQINQTAWKALHIVIGMVSDKDQDKVLALLPTNAKYYFTKASIPRAAEPEVLAAKAERFGLSGDCYPTVRQALSVALANAGENDLVFVGGSTFVVAEIL
ncbi:dihydrofolate synthase [Aquipluma nitroreducens]|uniref:Dihydrofolate synthase/folylpolyglutamate synthase n=1 Tax=Aquipluma nitroreducens TaxID=2010828 RepID=A0A5K7SC58_9BACT|nr:folylpolyglutamate synthase/dihydrofolate synthase family protein [Aquipluma nitroreducens]BBE19163.1 dihydrofolate synthase [Aquipluma nitroreducens]